MGNLQNLPQPFVWAVMCYIWIAKHLDYPKAMKNIKRVMFDLGQNKKLKCFF